MEYSRHISCTNRLAGFWSIKSKMSSSLSFAIPRLFCRIFAGMLLTMWWHAGSCIEYQLILSKCALNKLLRGTQTNVASGMVKD